MKRRILAGLAVGLLVAGGVLFGAWRTLLYADPLEIYRGQDAVRQILPPPRTTGGMPLMEALAARKSSRTFSGQLLELEEISNVLWAAWGVNRPDGKRTVPTAYNRQPVLLLIVLEDGVWAFEGQEHALIRILAGDYRGLYGGASATLLYCGPEKDAYAGMYLGAAFQNVGLFCASVGWNNVVKSTGIDALEGKLALPAGYRVTIVQSLGT